jgi:hypothetical protein
VLITILSISGKKSRGFCKIFLIFHIVHNFFTVSAKNQPAAANFHAIPAENRAVFAKKRMLAV